MSGFDPEKFAAKYVHYLPELEQAYGRAFERMNDRYDSTLVHAIDQQVLDESEPFYDPDRDGRPFRVQLPPNPYERLEGVPVDRERFERVLGAYRTTLEEALAAELLE